MADNARSMVNGMAGNGGSKAGFKLKTPQGFGVVTEVFADMKRHCAGSWFDGVNTQAQLISRAIQWSHNLSAFKRQVVLDAMSEVVARGDVAAPSLDTMRSLCQKITRENGGVNRSTAIIARDKAMREIRRGRGGDNG